MINTISNFWFDFFLNNSLQLLMFFGIIFIVEFLFRKSSPLFLSYLWIFVFLKAVIPPRIHLPVFSETVLFSKNIIPQFYVSNSEMSSSFPYKTILFFVWLSVVLFLLIHQIILEKNLNKKLSNSKEIDFLDILSSLKTKMKINKEIKIYLSENISVPLTRSFLKPKIFLPMNAKDWNFSELNSIIAHELAHIKRNDIVFLIFETLINILYFFHPLIWFARNRLSLQREKICDEMAIRAIKGNALDYGKCILSNLKNCLNLKPKLTFMNSFVFSKKSILQRFEYIINRKEEKMLMLKVAQKFILVFLIAAGLLYSIDDSIVVKTKIDSTKFVVFDVAPKLLEQVNPKYPEAEKESGKEGQIWLEVEVKINGTVGEISITENKTGSKILAKSSIDAVKKWKFEPALKDGKPIISWIRFPVTFSIE